MKQQIIISGIGGQGILFVTRIIAQAAINKNLNVLTAETHGMAQRGGTVISTVKIGDFESPLIRTGHANAGLFLNAKNLGVHQHLLKEDIKPFVNTDDSTKGYTIDASAIARKKGAPVLANLVLLGFCLQHSGLPFEVEEMKSAISQVTKPALLESNLELFTDGLTCRGSS